MDSFFLETTEEPNGGTKGTSKPKAGKREAKQRAGKRAHQQESESEDSGPDEVQQKKPGKKSRKNRPIEMSSKAPVSRFRAVVPTARPKPRDPRFEESTGNFTEQSFRSAYNFLEEQKSAEEQELRAELARTRNEDRKAEIRAALNLYRQDAAARQKRDRVKEMRMQWRQQQQQKQQGKPAAVASVSAPFLKKDDEQHLLLAERFLELKRSGKLGEVMAKRRKKNAAKDHRWMPYQE